MTSAVEVSFNDFVDYLNAYSVSGLLSKKELVDSLKGVHKRIYALICWQIELSRGKKEGYRVWLNESVSDLIQILPLLVQGYYKACAAMHRSAIENFVRFVVANGGKDPNAIQSTPDLFDTAKALARTDPELATRLSLLRQGYTNLCNYVHSAGKPYCTFAEALKEYPAFDPQALDTVVKELVRSIRAMNGYLLLIKAPQFASMFHANRDAVLDVLTPSEKRLIV